HAAVWVEADAACEVEILGRRERTFAVAGDHYALVATDLGSTRLMVVDSRGGRLLGERRELVDDDEWAWIAERASGDCDYLVLGTSPLFLLPRGVDGLQRWN